MKTSVKILLSVVLVIFMIPTVFLMAFNYRVKSKGYKPVAQEETWNRIDLGPSRYIKITSPDKEILDCKLIPADKPHYKAWPYGQGGNDSVDIHQKSDTLFITYIDVKDKDGDNDEQYRRSVEIFVSDWQQLDINGASVILDSTFGSQYASRQIGMSNSSLNLGRPAERDENGVETAGLAMPNNDTTAKSTLKITAANSKLFINRGYAINQLELDLDKTGLTVQNEAVIDAATGYISGNSHLNMAGRYLAKLARLIVK